MPATCPVCASPLTASGVDCRTCGAQAPPAPDPSSALPPGTRLQGGRYSVGRVLGEGGFGITYLGAHVNLKCPVAIKELFPEGSVRQGLRTIPPRSMRPHFSRHREAVFAEAAAVSRLTSPHIVEVHDTFLEHDTAYIVMEYLRGRTLHDCIEREGPLSEARVLDMGRDACDALDQVHAANLLHRDLKPDNIMLTDDGRLVLVDFGSARAFDEGRTVAHTRILSTDYAAPEMFGTRARFGPATDIFCLAATLYHALIGSPPPSAMDRIQDGGDLPMACGTGTALRQAIMQAMSLVAEDRPQSAADFKRRLDRMPDAGHVRRARIPPPRRPPPPVAAPPESDPFLPWPSIPAQPYNPPQTQPHNPPQIPPPHGTTPGTGITWTWHPGGNTGTGTASGINTGGSRIAPAPPPGARMQTTIPVPLTTCVNPRPGGLQGNLTGCTKP